MMKKSQRGVGLMEVLVAIVILALAILGFVALQLRAVEASIEAGNNVHATNIARDLTERMRINRLGVYNPTSKARGYSQGIPQQEPSPSCNTNPCYEYRRAGQDLYEISKMAADAGMSFTVQKCPNSAFKRLCVFVAWGDTYVTKGNISECYDESKGGYKQKAQCVMMETYNDED